jgi:hypothetical protein
MDFVLSWIKEMKLNFNRLNTGVATMVVNVILIMLALNLFSNNLGPLDADFNRAIGLFAIIFCLMLNVSKTKVSDKKQLFVGIGLLITSLLILTIIKDKLFWIAGLGLFIIGLGAILSGMNKFRREFIPLALAISLYLLFLVLILNVSQLYYLVVQFSLATSKFIGSMIGKPTLSLGPTISGTFILIGFLLLTTSSFIYSEKKKWKIFALGIGALVVAYLLWMVIHVLLFSSSTVDAMANMWIPFVLMLIPSLVFVGATKFEITEWRLARYNRTILKKSIVVCIVGIFISTTALMVLPFSNGESNGRIMVYTKDLLANLNKPDFNSYAQHAGGMFGLLTNYLNASGYTANLYNGTVNESALSSVNTFVVINLGRYFNDTEQHAIWTFVENGGSLLVLGDHTDMGGMMNHSNRLLEPIGVRYMFDAALPANEMWPNTIEPLLHPIAHGICNGDGVEISVGASLTIENPIKAKPAIIGRYALSDIGDYTNSGTRAFLGDYSYNAGEQLGDILLVASANYGRGKVMVFGDTSPFQNSAWTYSYNFVNTVFGWLNTPDTGNFTIEMAALIVLSFSLVLLVVFKITRNFHLILILAISTALIFSTSLNSITANDPQFNGNVVYIDSSHNELFNTRGFSDDGIDGLIHNLMRNEYLPFVSFDLHDDVKDEPKMIVLIAPTEQFTKSETSLLMDYMSKGGVIVLSCGWMDKEGASPLLEKLGLEILNQPMGPVPYIEKNPQNYLLHPKFMDAWPILIHNNSNVEIFYMVSIENESYNLAVFKRYGNGGLLLISDSRFLLNKNLESKDTYWPGNIQFLKDMFDELKEKGVLS